MNTYKIQKGGSKHFKNFGSHQEAQSWTDTTLGPGWIVSLAAENEKIIEQDITVTVDGKTEEDFQFGNYLLRLFVADNRRFEKAYSLSITKEQTEQLILDYKKLIDFCTIGAINELVVELAGITPNSIFTQARKDKYLSLIDSFLDS